MILVAINGISILKRFFPIYMVQNLLFHLFSYIYSAKLKITFLGPLFLVIFISYLLTRYFTKKRPLFFNNGRFFVRFLIKGSPFLKKCFNNLLCFLRKLLKSFLEAQWMHSSACGLRRRTPHRWQTTRGGSPTLG